MSDGRYHPLLRTFPVEPNPSFSAFAHEMIAPAGRDYPATYRDQELRKAWAINRLRTEGVLTLPTLPFIEGEAETRLRNPEEVARRFQALTLVAVKAVRMGHGAPREEVQTFAERVVSAREMRSDFSPRELVFIDDPRPSRDRLADFSWRWESAYLLAWALKLIDEPLKAPRKWCATARVEEIASKTGDLAAHGLRTVNEILNEADLAYRYHWAAFEERGRRGSLVLPVAAERHHALNWLIRVDDADWDDVPTDT